VSRDRAERRYTRETHWEILSGLAVVPLGAKRKTSTLAVVVYVFTDERDARRVARESGRKLFRVDRQRREEIVLRSKAKRAA
jgi:hypothetical protein